MKESIYKDYGELPLFLNASMVADLLRVSPSTAYAKTLSGILGHTNASFTLDTYTHVTTDMQKKASGIVGDFLDEIM